MGMSSYHSNNVHLIDEIGPLIYFSLHFQVMMAGASPMRPRIVHVVQQPKTIDPSLDLAVLSAATTLNVLDFQLSSLRSEVRMLFLCFKLLRDSPC